MLIIIHLFNIPWFGTEGCGSVWWGRVMFGKDLFIKGESKSAEFMV